MAGWIADDREVRVPLGHVADWCPICGRAERMAAAAVRRVHRSAFRPFSPLHRVAIAAAEHLLGPGAAQPASSEQIELTCFGCEMVVRTEAGRFERFEPPTNDPPIQIAGRTLRDRGEQLEIQLLLIDRLADGSATAADRVAHIVAAIRAVDAYADRRIGPGNVTLVQSLLIVVLLLSLPAAIALGYTGQPLVFTLAAGVVACSCFAALVWHSLDAGRSWAGRRLAPLIARGIRPLRPIDAELQAALDQTHLKVASKRVSLHRLRRAIDRDQSTVAGTR